MDQISELFNLIYKHENKSCHSLNLTASENVLSPLARLPFLLDAYNRYYLDDLRLFGKWSFPSGQILGEIEKSILEPTLKKLTKTEHVNTRPISGMNCMTIALLALTKPGDKILTIPTSNGGHASTAYIAKKLNLELIYMPFIGIHNIDYESLKKILKKDKPSLVYIDQATLLFPLDPWPIRKLIEELNISTLIHYDSSHTNGLIFGDAIFNPINRGAHSFGGSTHKTLPGPHKGFLATNDINIATAFEKNADCFVSHHNPASSISLAITLIEFQKCNGIGYSNKIIENCRYFSSLLTQSDFYVASVEDNFTNCHQIWVHPNDISISRNLAEFLYNIGIIINIFDSLPGINFPSYRISLSEFTRRGGSFSEVKELAEILIHSLKTNCKSPLLLHELVENLLKKLQYPQYCFSDFSSLSQLIPKEYSYLFKSIDNFYR